MSKVILGAFLLSTLTMTHAAQAAHCEATCIGLSNSMEIVAIDFVSGYGKTAREAFNGAARSCVSMPVRTKFLVVEYQTAQRAQKSFLLSSGLKEANEENCQVKPDASASVEEFRPVRKVELPASAERNWSGLEPISN